MESYQLEPPPPLRAYLIAGAVAAAGAALTVAASAASWGPVAVALGVALLVAGVALLVAAWVLARRMAVRVELSEAGYRIVEREGVREGTWADVTGVTLAEDGHRLTLHHSPDRRTILTAPRGPYDPQLGRLGQSMAVRLDADRGYSSLPS